MKIQTGLMALATAALGAGAVSAASYRLGQLEVTQPWSRPAAAGTNGIGYMVIANHGKTADALVGVESPAAAKVEMHASAMAGGVMTMSQQTKVAIPAGGKATFGPGAYHLMLITLKSALKPGDSVPATLRFASGARIKTAFRVSINPPAADPMADMPGMSH